MKKHSTVALGFLALILIGAFVLSAPWSRAAANAGWTWSAVPNALFTACSAVCVTGLTVVDIAQEYSRTGQIALMVLVQLGCLGLMTFGTFLLIAVGRRLSLSQEFSLKNAYGEVKITGFRGLVIWVVLSMLTIELIGAVLLYLRLHDAYQAVFYSVMGFCNAGFSLRADSLAQFIHDKGTVFVLACETILGGIGFMVLCNICTFKFWRRGSGRRGRLSLHSRVVLRYTFWLLAISFVLVLALEWNGAFRGLTPGERLMAGFYQAVTPRTCGFCVVPTESLRPLTRLLYEVLMFIGGAPGSVAAGIKVTTLAVIICTLTAMCRGEEETVVARRVVPLEIVRESIVIVTALLALIVLVTGALFLTEEGGPIAREALVFEAVSAITTTGLSMGETTSRLSACGRVVIMVAMFMGRLGALTVVMMIGDRESTRHVRYPTEELVVG